MNAPTDIRGIILLAHGSRDPLWRGPIEAVRAQIEQAQPGLPVRCAYLELCTPGLAAAMQELAALGAGTVAVVPLFVGAGRHVREDLPRMVQDLGQAWPQVRLSLLPPIGEDARLTALMARIACEAVLQDQGGSA